LDGGAAGHKATTYIEQYKRNKCTQMYVPQVGFEPTIPVFEQAKMALALDRVATVIGSPFRLSVNFLFPSSFIGHAWAPPGCCPREGGGGVCSQTFSYKLYLSHLRLIVLSVLNSYRD
jgi:hypothetical protein